MTPDPYEPHLKRAAQLFESGDIVQAGQIWQAILKKVPAHAEARAGLYKVKLFFDARATQDGLEEIARFEQTQVDYIPSPAAKDSSEGFEPSHPSIAAAPSQPSSQPEPEAPAGGLDEEAADKLLKDGCTLYDMGMVAEAIEKWTLLKTQWPDHPQVQQYLDMGNRDLQAATRLVPPPMARPLAPPKPEPPAAEALAPIDFQPEPPAPQMTRSLPGSPLSQRPSGDVPVQKRLSPELTPGDIQMAESPEPPVNPPAPLTAPKNPEHIRTGLKMPDIFNKLEGEIPPVLKKPAVVAGIVGFLVLSYVGVYFLRSHQKDKRLVEQVAAESQSARAPLTQTLQIADLSEKTEDIRQQAQKLLEESPLLSFYRCREIIRRNPLDAEAAKLMALASSQLIKAPIEGSLADLDQALGQGNLEGAERILTSMLCQSPEDPVLMAKMAYLCKDLSERHAMKERWDEVESHLLMGRCLFPEDKSWNARLQLMTYLKSAGPEARKNWIQLLG